MIGYAEIKETELNKWVESEIDKAGKAPINDPKAVWQQANWSKYFYTHQCEMNSADHLVEDHNYGAKDDNYRKFTNLVRRLGDENQRMQVFFADDFACVVGIPEHRYILPIEFVEITYLKSYDSMSAGELIALGDSDMSSAMLPVNMTNTSMDSLKDEMADKKAKIAAAEMECKNKIEEARQQFYLKEQELKALLEKQTAELRVAQEKLEKQIFVLDTQIYGIRCYLGEVIDFTLIRDGKRASMDTPIVVFQKFRYLDEELGKYFALYGSETIRDDSFIQILKHRDDIRDLFCGSERSISVVKVSRTGTQTGRSEKVNNMLKDYEYLHAHQIAILLRDGERLYIGWTDEDRVRLHSEDIFLRPGQTVVKEASETPKDDWHAEILERQRKDAETKEQHERISRYFLISILQGVADRGDMIKFPAKTKITEESKYVRFSYAEGWLTDNRFGTFVDIMEKSKAVPVRKGDTILTALSVTRNDRSTSSEDSVYCNDRGIGEKNRTHGAFIPGFEILKINKILKSCRAKVTFDVMKAKPIKDGFIYSYDHAQSYCLTTENPPEPLGTITQKTVLSEENYKDAHKNNPTVLDAAKAFYDGTIWDVQDQDIVYTKEMTFRISDVPDLTRYGIAHVTDAKELDEPTTHAYVSVESEASYYRGTKSRVNFQIYPDEYIRVDYLCSTWLSYVITTGNLGDFRLAGKRMSYADSLKYLNKLLDQVRNREEEEKKLLTEVGLSDWISTTPEWDRILCEWRIENSVPELKIRSAVQFAKQLESIVKKSDSQDQENYD